jgi:hypothetical protein
MPDQNKCTAVRRGSLATCVQPVALLGQRMGSAAACLLRCNALTSNYYFITLLFRSAGWRGVNAINVVLQSCRKNASSSRVRLARLDLLKKNVAMRCNASLKLSASCYNVLQRTLLFSFYVNFCEQ